MQKFYGIVDLIRLGYFDSDQVIRDRIRARRLPKPMKFGGKLRWPREVIERWFERGSIMWIPRREKE